MITFLSFLFLSVVYKRKPYISFKWNYDTLFFSLESSKIILGIFSVLRKLVIEGNDVTIEGHSQVVSQCYDLFMLSNILMLMSRRVVCLDEPRCYFLPPLCTCHRPSREGGPQDYRGKSAKIEEECAPVPPFSCPRNGDIFRRQWVAVIVSHCLIAFLISPGWKLCFQIMPEGSENWVTLM